MSDKKSFQYVKIMLPLFGAAEKFCSTNRLFMYRQLVSDKCNCMRKVILTWGFLAYDTAFPHAWTGSRAITSVSRHGLIYIKASGIKDTFRKVYSRNLKQQLQINNCASMLDKARRDVPNKATLYAPRSCFFYLLLICYFHNRTDYPIKGRC